MGIKSRLQIQGTLRIYEFNSDFNLESPVPNINNYIRACAARKVVETSNLITDVGLAAFAGLIGGGLGVHTVDGNGYGPNNFEDLRVTQLHVTQQVGPTAPSPSDTALQGAAYRFVDSYPADGSGLMTSMQMPTAGEVRFAGLLQQHELPGSVLTEEGLLTPDSKLIARTTFNYVKNVDVAVQFEHTISFARA